VAFGRLLGGVRGPGRLGFSEVKAYNTSYTARFGPKPTTPMGGVRGALGGGVWGRSAPGRCPLGRSTSNIVVMGLFKLMQMRVLPV